MATLDPRTAIFGRPLDEKSWDITARNEFLGRINQRGLRTSPHVRSALRNDHVYIAYRSDAGTLSLDVDERNRSLVGSAPLDPDNAVSSFKGTAGTLRLPLRRVHTSAFELPFAGVATSDDSEIEGSVTWVMRHDSRHGSSPAKTAPGWNQPSSNGPAPIA